MEALLVALVISGNARFTVLNPQMIRMEWSATAAFEDRPSMVFLDRTPTETPVEVNRADGWLTLRTEALTLRYREDSGRFGPDNLSITLDVDGRAVTWRPGMPDDGNLLGTRKSLDNISGSAPLGPGLVSRAGWALVDDSKTPLLPTGEGSWPIARPDAEAIDWVFFGYGHDYPRALRDYTRVAGRIPLPPRFAFGSWWSRYWPYTEQQVHDLIAEFDQHDVPLDVLVLDMDWHKEGWSGYTWSDAYFPDPERFLKWAKAQGLKVTLNLHPAFAIEKHETRYADFVRDMGGDPTSGAPIPFDHFNPAFVKSYFKNLIHPLEAQGVDFWWLDYGGHTPPTKIAGLDGLLWCNAMHYLDMKESRPERRPLMFSRWGGLANHRYQIGFSGDTHSTWASLAFQPYMTATAGNVAFPFWSHDVGGHYLGPVDGELYARWIQYAVFNPILRTHATVNPEAERRIWAFSEEVFETARAAFHLRYELIPYIYSAARQCYDAGMPLCRPLYYAWPEWDAAYAERGAYLFGDDLLVAPVVSPREALSAYATTQAWIPPGDWVHWYTGEVVTGPGERTLVSSLEEIPVFVRAGAIVPAQSKTRRSGAEPVDPMVLHVFPGPSGQTRVYEDDGHSMGYQHGAFALTEVTQQTLGQEQTVEIAGTTGEYAGMPEQRAYELRLHGVFPPVAVRINGRPVSQTDTAAAPGWSYDADALCLLVRVPRRSVREPARVVIQHAWSADDLALLREGLNGRLRMLEAVADAAKGAVPASWSGYAQLRTLLRRDPASAVTLAHELHRNWNALVQDVLSRTGPSSGDDAVARLIVGGGCALTVEPDAAGGNHVCADARLTSHPRFGALADVVGDIELTTPDGWHATDGSDKLRAGGSLANGKVVGVRASFAPNEQPRTGVISAAFTIHAGARTLRETLRVPLLPGIDKWWIIGPFDNPSSDLDDPFAPEKEINLQGSYPGKGGEPIGWRKAERRIAPGDDLTAEFPIDLHAFYGVEHSSCAAYGLTYLHAPRDMDASLALGSDDGVVVWLNGEEVHRAFKWRPYASRQDRVPIRLRAGSNTLLLKVIQGGGGWGFGAHVETPDGQVLPEVRASLDPEPK